MANLAWSTQQLAEFVASISRCTTEASAAQITVERAAVALDAEVAAIMCDGEVIAAVGYAEGAEPVDELKRIQPGAQDCRLKVPSVGWCAVEAADLAYPPGATLLIARPRRLTSQETALLDGMARVAAMTMTMLGVLDHERAEHEEVDRLASEQAALRRIATRVARGEPPRVVFAAVAQEVGRLLLADLTLIVRYENDEVLTVGGWNFTGKPVPMIGKRKLTGRNVADAVHRTGRPAMLDNYENASGDIAAEARAMGITSSAGAPISIEGRLWGLVVAASTHEGPLPPNTAERLAAFTELVATAIANAEAREELRRVADEQAALRRVATLVARGAPSAALFDAVTEEIGRLLPVDATLLCRYEPDGAVVKVGMWTRGSTPVPGFNRGQFGGRNVSTLVFETGRSARIDDFGEDAGPATLRWLAAGLRSAVGVPISVEGRLWGVVMAMSMSDEPLPSDAEARLTGFTELVATAIANAEANAELKASRARVIAAADQTRRCIERDLHDGAQQRLVTLALQLRVVQVQVPPQLDQLNAELGRIALGLSSTLDELREFARGIHPAILARGGLAAALKTLSRRSSIDVTLDTRIQERIPEPIKVAAYYVVSEALANAAKHAEASVAHVQVDASGGVLRLTVSDDGIGGADPTRGSGLIGLKDRVDAVGGTFTIQSRSGEGTQLLAGFPLRPVREVPG